MADERKSEQSMDDILASIRRIISDDSVVPEVVGGEAGGAAGLASARSGAAPGQGHAEPRAASDDAAFRVGDDLSDILEPQVQIAPQSLPRGPGHGPSRREPSLVRPTQFAEQEAPGRSEAAPAALAPWPFDRGEQPAAAPGLRDKLVALEEARSPAPAGPALAPAPIPTPMPTPAAAAPAAAYREPAREQEAASINVAQPAAREDTDAIALVRSAMQDSQQEGQETEMADGPARVAHLNGATAVPQQPPTAPRGTGSGPEANAGANDGAGQNDGAGPDLELGSGGGPRDTDASASASASALAAAGVAAALSTAPAARPDGPQAASDVQTAATAPTPAPTPATAPATAPTPALAPTPGGQHPLEDVVAVALQPLLREWIDANLAKIAREVLEAEVARSRGRGDRQQ